MTKSLLPWSLKGVSLEARARAKAAATEADEPLGKWLGDTIRQVADTEAAQAAREAVGRTTPPEPAPRAPATAVDLSPMVAQRPVGEPPTFFAAPEIYASAPEEDTAPAAGGLSIPDAAPPPAAPDGAPAALPSPEPTVGIANEHLSASGAPDDWRAAFAELARRLDETERRMTANVAPLQASVERLVTRLDRNQPPPRRGWRLPRFLPFKGGR